MQLGISSLILLTAISLHYLTGGETIRAKGLYIVCHGMEGLYAVEIATDMDLDILQDYFQDRW